MDKKKLRNDIILVGSLLLVAVIALVFVLVRKVKSNTAKIYVQDKIVEVVDLTVATDADYYIEGLKGTLHVKRHNHAVGVVESNCPHQDCVHMGYVKTSTRPIICAYNNVTIIIDGSSFYDAEI